MPSARKRNAPARDPTRCSQGSGSVGATPALFRLVSPLSHRIAAITETLVEGLPGKALGERAARISEAYRANHASRDIIADAADAAVYALTRMPATAAAVEAVLAALAERAPDFMPRTVCDAGAGPGTASLVALESWPEAELSLVDSHPGLLGLAERLFEVEAPAARAGFVVADIARPDAKLPEADLVIASYALTELGDAAYQTVAERLWAATRAVFAIIEPGRPRDYRRLMAFRARALGQGAQMVAPCPHARACPLAGADWCHFSVRLPRSRSHMRLKGAALGYEDEKYAFLVLARPGVALSAPAPRVLAAPEVLKHEIRLKLCETDGQVGVQGFGRKHPHFGRIRRASWGTLLSNLEQEQQE